METDTDRGWVYFHKGDLIYARRRGPTERLGERLLRLGYISESQLMGANLRASMARPHRRIGQIFLEAGSLNQETLQKVVQDQIREVVVEMLSFSQGSFQFYAGRLPADEDILLDVSLDLLLLEGLQKLDELNKDQLGDSESTDP